MIVPNRDVATGEAAKLELADLKGGLAFRTPAKKQTSGATIPIFGICRNAHKARRLGRKLLLRILRSLRNSEMGNVRYNKVKDMRYLESEDEHGLPPRLVSLAGGY